MAQQGIKTSDLRDLLESTKEARPFGGLVFTQDLVRYPIMDQWFGGQEASRIEVQGGTNIEETLQLRDSENAEFIRPTQRRSWQGVDVMESISLDWVTAETHWVVTRDEALRHLRNTAKGSNVGDRAIDLVESKRTSGMMSLANLLEKRAWEKPDSESDPLFCAGIPYWIPRREYDDPGKGFDGLSQEAPSSDVAGLNPSDHDRWASYCAGGKDADGEYYLEINDAAIRTMREMHKRLDFRAPELVSQSVEEPYAEQNIYTGIDTSLELEDYLDDNNDGMRRENELAWVEGNVVFKRRPIQTTEVLDGSTDLGDNAEDKPIYFVDHGNFFVYMLEGNQFLEDDTITPSDRPDVMVTPVSVKFNFMCINRRRQGVMSIVSDTS